MSFFSPDKINSQKIIIVGDVMLDAYVFGKVERISPEAPVPVVAEQSRSYRLGGAANVALNLKAMGATPLLFGVIGSDDESLLLKRELERNSISSSFLVSEKKRPTTVKTRIIGNNHQLLRVDREVTNKIESATENELFNLLALEIANANALIFEDYEKGLLHEDFIQRVIDLCLKNQVPVVVDPKEMNFMAYRNATLFKPNLKEIKGGLKLHVLETIAEIEEAAKKLIRQMNLTYIMVTLSERGVLICSATETFHIPAHVRKIADVSGAGDTVVSLAALCLAQKIDLRSIAELSNLAGGLVCEEVGVVPISKIIFLEEAKKLALL